MAEAAWQIRTDGVEIRLRVTPRGGRDAVDGIEALSDGRSVLKVRVRAVPEDGAANEAVRRLLAEALGCSVTAVNLAAGATGRIKTFRVEGDAATLAASLAAFA
jgi:uncharacterized protein YggU (UPF0235/DUF167 family)